VRVFYLFLLLFLFSTIGFAQDRYFYDLNGFEDSTGTSQLFYRFYDQEVIDCIDFDGNTSASDVTQNHIYHFDSDSTEDAIFLKDYYRSIPDCDFIHYQTGKFIFPTNNPDSVLTFSGQFGGLFGGWTVNLALSSGPYLGYINPMGLFSDPETKHVIITTPIYDLVVKSNKSTDIYKKSFIYDSKDSIWSTIETMYDIPDSLLLDFTITGIHTSNPGTYVGLRDSFFVVSNDFGKTFSDSVNIHFEDWMLNESTTIKNTYFLSDSTMYLVFDHYYNPQYRNQSTQLVYQIRKLQGTLTFIDIGKQVYPFQFYPDLDIEGHFYFSRHDSLFQSIDSGKNRTLLHVFGNEITGLYKKPGSDLLFVLTQDKLLQYDLSSESIIDLRSVPVSLETDKNTHDSFSLYQNYPNPFNPSTVIGYQLPVNSKVTLKVFDILGREVALLVNEQQPAGSHEVTFDATHLSSGVYFYRLEVGEMMEYRTMLFIK
tara:strand:+ start:160025 stop:161473 length:1449 start_codon:yes stop_codon:yes gene_type:complete